MSDNLFFMKQYAKNACGTIAMVHVALNAGEDIIQKDSLLDKFRGAVQGKSAEEAGQIFKKQEQVKQVHKEAVVQGQSQCCDEVDRHFIAFVLKDGDLYELDGTKVEGA